jgi:aspartate aminotransferase-like enzyme
MNPLPEICCTLAKYPDVALILDTVSSFSAMKIDMDALGIDVMLTGSQKALALPPGFSLFAVSEKAFARTEKQKDRGYYFDFLEFKKQQANWMTPTTPSIGHIFALESKLEEIFEEGLDARYARHARANALVHDWVKSAGFDFFAEEGFRSKTLTCVANNKNIDVVDLAKRLREKHHLVIDPGYGKLRGKTFRLSNMGDETEETVPHLLACLDDSLKKGNPFSSSRLEQRCSRMPKRPKLPNWKMNSCNTPRNFLMRLPSAIKNHGKNISRMIVCSLTRRAAISRRRN